jgi:hypothetical protein
MPTFLSPRQFVIAATFATSSIFPAGLTAADVAAGKSNPSEEPPTVELTVSPAGTPVPALKYRLLPTFAERTRGNAALDYYRASVQNARIPQHATKSLWEREALLAVTPLEKFPQDEVARELQDYHYVFVALERASFRDHCEWQVPLEDGFATQLPEFQAMREPARLLVLRARLQMARGELDEALATLRTNYQISQNITECRTIINALIGVAIAAVTREQLETFVQQPHAPNLYWALSELPVPLVDFRDAIKMEAVSVEKTFPEITELRSRRLTRDEAQQLSDRILEKWIKLDLTNGLPKTVDEAKHRFATTSASTYPEAKQTLIEAGRSKDDVEAMPVEQAIWAASFRRWQLFWDDLTKWTFLPAPQRLPGVAEVERRIAQFHQAHRDGIFELTQLLPAVPQALAASDRADRQLALLRIEEAIRLYAQAHSGQLPDSLDKIDAVPIPVDPMTGKPFLYRLQGDSAVVETPPTPASVPQNKLQGRRYVIHVRK